MTSILNEGLPRHYWEKYTGEPLPFKGLDPRLIQEIHKIRGGMDVLRAIEEAEAGPASVEQAIDPELANSVAVFKTAVEKCALRQLVLTEQIASRLQDPEFLKGILKGKKLKGKQERFLRYFVDKVLSGNARTSFAKYPTGVGKTWMMAMLLAAAHNPEMKTHSLVFSPRTGLNEQNMDGFKEFLEEARIETVGNDADVDVGTYGLGARNAAKEIKESKFGDYDMILLDELHRGFGPGFLNFLRKKYPNALIVGFSATPYVGSIDSGTSKSARHFFEVAIDEVSLPEACEDGDITQIRVVRLQTKEKAFTGGETTDRDLDEKMDKNERIAIALKIAREIPEKEKTVLFCAGVSHAENTAKALTEQGYKAGFVHSKMDDDEIRKTRDEFKEGKLQFLCNADMLIEGFDDVEVKHAVILRLTKSLWLYEQMIGRACRLNPRDPNKVATVWDVVGQNSGQCTLHGLALLYDQLADIPPNGSILLPKKKRSGGGIPGDQDEPFDITMFDTDEYSKVVEVDGIEKVLIPLDDDYFSKPENVRNDLLAFAAAAGCGDPREMAEGEQRSGAPQKMKKDCHLTRAELSNGSKGISLRAYLNAAKQGVYETPHATLCQLLIQAGFSLPEGMLNEEYLEDQEVAKTELTRVVEELGFNSPEFVPWTMVSNRPVQIQGKNLPFKTVVAIIYEIAVKKWGWGWNTIISEPSSILYWDKFINKMYGTKSVMRITEDEYFSREDILLRDLGILGDSGRLSKDLPAVIDDQVELSCGKLRLGTYLGKFFNNLVHETESGNRRENGPEARRLWVWQALQEFNKDEALSISELIRKNWKRGMQESREKGEGYARLKEAREAEVLAKEDAFLAQIKEAASSEPAKKKIVRNLLKALGVAYGCIEEKIVPGQKPKQVVSAKKLKIALYNRYHKYTTLSTPLVVGETTVNSYSAQEAILYLVSALGMGIEDVNQEGMFKSDTIENFIRVASFHKLKDLLVKVVDRTMQALKTETPKEEAPEAE